MKIAMLTAVPPLPATEGMRHRAGGVAAGLAALGQLDIHVVARGPVSPSDLECSRLLCSNIYAYQVAGQLPSGLGAKIRRAFNARWVEGREAQLSTADRSRLLSSIASADVVWVHTLHVADRVGVFRWKRAVLDFDDLVSEKEKLLAQSVASKSARLKHRWNTRTWRQRERQAAARFSAFSVCSEPDVLTLARHLQAVVVPNAIDPRTPEPAGRNSRTGATLGFIGMVKYPPNLQGLIWFIRNVLPRIRAEIPKVRLRVVGRLPENRADLVAEGVDLLGFVEDPAEEMATWSASVVPLLVGGGTRLKIISTIRAGCPVVSTSVGAFGLKFTNGESILVADAPALFAELCVRLIRAPAIGQQMIDAGRRIVRDEYLWPSMVAGVSEAVRRARMTSDDVLRDVALSA